jgi:hypothetical protein
MLFPTAITILIQPYALTGQVILHLCFLIHAGGLNTVKLLILLEGQEVDHFLYPGWGGFLVVNVPVLGNSDRAFDRVLLGRGALDVDDLWLFDEIVEIKVKLDSVE